MAVIQEGLQVTIVDSTGAEVSNPATHVLNVSSGGGGGGAATIADGADVTQGAIADAAVNGDNPGTLSAKLRGLNKNFDVALSTRTKPADQQHVIIDSGSISNTGFNVNNIPHVINDASANVGLVYICDRPNPSKTTGIGILGILGIPTQNVIAVFSDGNPSAPASMNAIDYYVEADNAGDGVLACYTR